MITICIVLFLGDICVAQGTYNYKGGDYALQKDINTGMLQELPKVADSLKSKNAAIFCEVTIDSVGNLSTIKTWNPTQAQAFYSNS